MIPPFKQCTECGRIWDTREALLRDPQLKSAGYQPNLAKPEQGLLLFQHACGNTLSVPLELFLDLGETPFLQRRRCLLGQCPDDCRHPHELNAERTECECAFVRELLKTTRAWPKGPTLQGPGDPDAA